MQPTPLAHLNPIGDFQPQQTVNSSIEILHWKGFIYNLKTLKSQLSWVKQSGVEHNSSLLVAAIEKWGDQAHRHVEGCYLLIYTMMNRCYVLRGTYDSPELFYVRKANQTWYSLDLELLFDYVPKPIRISSSVIGHQFSFHTNQADETPFCDVKSLAAGQTLIILANGSLQPSVVNLPYVDVCAKLSSDTAESWRETLSNVLVEIASEQNNIGLLLSGGLDSGALASIASLNNIPIQTITFALPDFPAEDESKYGRRLACELGFKHHHLVVQSKCFEDISCFPISLRRPALNPYQRMINEGYVLAEQVGVNCLWTGSVGDDVYPPIRNMYSDLWRHKRFIKMISLMLAAALTGNSIPHGFKSLINTILGRKPRHHGLPHYIRRDAPHNTPDSLSYPALVGNGRSLEHRSRIFHYDNINGLAFEREFTSKHNLERVHPFMHPAIIALGLRTPTYLAHDIKVNKLIMRSALSRVAPQDLLQRARVGVLNDYFRAGWDANLPDIQSILFDSAASWPRFVRKSTLSEMMNQKVDQGYMLACNCLALELWLNKLRSKGLNYRFE